MWVYCLTVIKYEYDLEFLLSIEIKWFIIQYINIVKYKMPLYIFCDIQYNTEEVTFDATLNSRNWLLHTSFFSILMFGIPAIYKYTTTLFSFYNWEVFPYITPCVYAIGLNAQTTSAYLTLCVTLERYVAVCQPLKVR